MKKILPTLLIVVGLGLLLTPFGMDQIVKYQTNQMMDVSAVEDSVQDEEEIEGEFDYSVVQDVDLSMLINGSKDIDKDLIIGDVSIPDLDMHIPIMKGLTNANLVAGAATMKEDQSMGTGNYSLAGHNMKNEDLLFGSLMDIELDTMVYISNKDTTYEYKIYETEVVPDSDLSILSDDRADEHGEPIISLMTCYYTSDTGKRFFAYGELVDI